MRVKTSKIRPNRVQAGCRQVQARCRQCIHPQNPLDTLRTPDYHAGGQGRKQNPILFPLMCRKEGKKIHKRGEAERVCILPDMLSCLHPVRKRGQTACVENNE